MANSSFGFEHGHYTKHTKAPPIQEMLMHISCDKDNPYEDYFSPTFTGVVAATLILIAIFAILGNLMVILVVLKNRSMRDSNRSTNFFLCNLAMADFLVGVLNIPFSVHTLIKECWDFPAWFCTMNSFSMSLLYGVSMHTLMYISIHKCLSIRRTYRNYFIPIPNKVCYIMIFFTWLWGFLLALLTTVILSTSVYKPKTMQCGPKYPKFEDISFILHGVNQFIGILIPLFIMIFAYVQIFIYIHKITVARRRLSGETEVVTDSGQKGVVKTLVIVLACFFLCWTPYVTYTNYATFTKDKSLLPYFLNPLAYIFGFLNSACNPIIYAWRFPEFRKGYWDLLKRTTYVVTIVDGGRRVVRRHSHMSDLSRRSIAENRYVIDSPGKVTTPTEPHANGNHHFSHSEDSVPLTPPTDPHANGNHHFSHSEDSVRLTPPKEPHANCNHHFTHSEDSVRLTPPTEPHANGNHHFSHSEDSVPLTPPAEHHANGNHHFSHSEDSVPLTPPTEHHANGNHHFIHSEDSVRLTPPTEHHANGNHHFSHSEDSVPLTELNSQRDAKAVIDNKDT